MSPEGAEIQIVDRRIEHNAHRALRFDVARKLHRAQAARRAAADAAEYGDIGIFDDRVADGLLRCEWIDGKYGVRVAVPDNGQIGREYEALQPAAVDDDAACLIDLLRHTQNVAQAAVDVGGLLFHTRVLLSLFFFYITKL